MCSDWSDQADGLPVETPLRAPAIASFMPSVPALLGLDPLFWILAAVLLGLIFFGFLLFRRTVMGFKEGMDDTKR